jgi:DNA recombination protein RmuC
MEISRRAEEIQRKLNGMGNYIEDLGSKLETLFRHIGNASNRISDVRTSFDNLKGYYTSVCRLEEVMK